MPHMAHMIFAGVMCIIFGAMTLLMVSLPYGSSRCCCQVPLSDAHSQLSCKQVKLQYLLRTAARHCYQLLPSTNTVEACSRRCNWCTTVLQATGMCDLNPLTRSVLASADAATSFKLLALKMVLVVICSCLDAFGPAQVVIGLLCVTGVSSFLFYDVSGCRHHI